MSVWQQIKEAIEAGEDPVVYLSYSMLASLVVPKLPKRKGPAPKKRVTAFSLYGKVPLGGRKTFTFRCWNPYCRKRVTGRYVCNDDCKGLANEHLQTAINHLNQGDGPIHVEEVPDVPIFDDQGRDRNAATREGDGKIRDRRGRKPKGYRGSQSTSANARGYSLGELLRGEEGEGKKRR